MEIYKFMSKLTNELNKNLFYNIEIIAIIPAIKVV